MDFPADRAGGARKKFWLGLPKSTLQYESHLLSIPKYPEQYAKHFPAIFYLLCCASQHHVLLATISSRNS